MKSPNIQSRRPGRTLLCKCMETLCWAVVCCVTAGGCSGAMSIGSNQESETIRVDGSSTVYPISAHIAEMYGEQHPASRVIVGFHGTGGGMKKFIAGEIDICNASREMSPSEEKACSRNGVEYQEFQIAYDGLACVTSKANTWCDSLTIDQLKRIWTPDLPAEKWSDLDSSWPDQELRLYGPGANSGTFDYFTSRVVGFRGKSRADYSPSEDDNVLVHGVASSKYGFGYFGLAFFEENKHQLKLLAVDSGDGGIRPNVQTVADRTYPLWRPLFIYVRASSLEREEIRDYVEFYLQNASKVVVGVGYVPIEQEILDDSLKRLEELK